MNQPPEPDIAFHPEAFGDHIGFSAPLAMIHAPEMAIPFEGIVPSGDQVWRLLAQYCDQHQWSRPTVLRDRRSPSNHRDLAGSSEQPWGKLLYPDGSPRYQVLCVPGGEDREFVRSVSGPRAMENVRFFVQNGGGYVGVCAGMCLATRGYYDEQGEPLNRQAAFAGFTGLWPYYTLNLHNVRRVALKFNSELPADHPMRMDFPDTMEGGRYNDGCAMFRDEPHGCDPNTEYLVEYAQDGTTQGERLDGLWASIAWVDPSRPRSGRLVLNGWHPEASCTPEHHRWFLRCVEYARARTRALPPAVRSCFQPGQCRRNDEPSERLGDGQLHFHRLEPGPAGCRIKLSGKQGLFRLMAARGRFATPLDHDLADLQELTVPGQSNQTPWTVAVQGHHRDPGGVPYTIECLAEPTRRA